ncbi:ABC transporter [Paenibacillus swuensis]|uniref:ABC transporter n=1 Tax=Paenibacillus swuensis TaxID=1178515 RepID=A0A172TKU4_9BACL|nr:ABC transporter ATP-binding protein [Paenibacillus swuensis]ANE47650.1 ABC transporter [Paenibacillus swuensis]
MSNNDYAVEMHQVVKRFGSVIANDGVDFKARSGEVHALLGENGAGKSTVMCMLSGVYRPDSGQIKLLGHSVNIRSPKEALNAGVGMVYQNFRLVGSLTATENIVLGEGNTFFRGSGWMKRKNREVEGISSKFGLYFPVDRPVWQLSVGEQQRVEIVKTLYRGAEIIILDEPTSVLTPQEAEQLFDTLTKLKHVGKTIIITTHKLKEVMRVADHISVMRKGKLIYSVRTRETNEHELASLMVGRSFTSQSNMNHCLKGDLLLQMKELDVYANHGRQALKQLNMNVYQGEIVGIAGVAGNGQSELAEVITGLRSWKTGSITFNGYPLKNGSVAFAIAAGISHVPENRMKSGLAGSLGALDNLLTKTYSLKDRSRWGMLRTRNNHTWSQSLVDQFQVKTSGVNVPVSQLSGGNQQKLLFARELDYKPRLMVAVHPTQGLDVGATEQVYHLLSELRASGGSVLLISEDLDELLKLSDRILVMFNGRICGEFSSEPANREPIGRVMAGLHPEEGEAG